MQRDPAGYVDGMNLYAYVMNNPLRFIDSNGLTAKALSSGGFFGLGGVAEWFDAKVSESNNILGRMVDDNPGSWMVAGAVGTSMEVARGFADVLRLVDDNPGWNSSFNDSFSSSYSPQSARSYRVADSEQIVSDAGNVGNNPVNLVDPFGLAPGDWWHPIVHPVEFYNRAHELRIWGHQNFPGEVNSDDRHSTVSYMLATEYGPDWARAAGAANEIQGFVMHDMLNLPDRIEGNSPWAFQWKDLQANEVGIQRAIQEKSDQGQCK